MADRRWQVEKAGPYAVGIALLVMCFCMEYTLIIGETPFFHQKVSPAVPAELVGRIIGTFETFTGLFLAWLYQTSRSSQAKDETIGKLSEKP